MKITSVEIKSYTLRYKEVFKIAKGDLEGAPLVFIFIQTDEGVTGVGYAPGSAPFIDGETQESVAAAVTGIMKPVLVGQDPTDIEAIMTEIDKRLQFNYRAKAGVEIALYDLLGKILNVPLFKLWGGLCRDKVPVVRMVGIASPDLMAAKAKDLVAQGFGYLKIKIGKDTKGDITRVRAIRAAVGPDVGLFVDANQGYTVKEAINVLKALEDMDIFLVEQPVRADDFEGLALVRKSTSIPVEADESVRTFSDVLNIIRLGAADFISLKPFKFGGFRPMRKIATLCESANIKCVVGTTPGSSLIDAANVHFIASLPYIDTPAEIGESFRMANDPVTGLQISNGFALVPNSPGIGITLTRESHLQM